MDQTITYIPPQEQQAIYQLLAFIPEYDLISSKPKCPKAAPQAIHHHFPNLTLELSIQALEKRKHVIA